MDQPEKHPSLSVIIPVYNEESTVVHVLEAVNAQRQALPGLQVIVVDDGSRDATPERLAESADLIDVLVTNPVNLGKGGAVKAALARADGDYVLFQDADLEYDPEEFTNLMMPVRKHAADVVLGSRLCAPPCTRVAYFWHKVGNRFITLFFNLLYNTTFTDVYSCYLLFRRELVDPDELGNLGWGQHAEILGTATLRSRRLYEVAINYYGRGYDEGKKIRWHHTFDVLATMLSTRVRHRADRART